MGGQRELIVKNPPLGQAAMPVPPRSSVLPDIRIHESQGEVHLHDDANNMKVAIPLEEFNTRWTKWQPHMFAEDLVLVDTQRQTVARVMAVIDGSELKAQIRIYEVSLHSSFAALQKFASGK